MILIHVYNIYIYDYIYIYIHVFISSCMFHAIWYVFYFEVSWGRGVVVLQDCPTNPWTGVKNFLPKSLKKTRRYEWNSAKKHILYTLLKINMLNPKSWRFGSDDFSIFFLFNWVVLISHIIFQGCIDQNTLQIPSRSTYRTPWNPETSRVHIPENALLGAGSLLGAGWIFTCAGVDQLPLFSI